MKKPLIRAVSICLCFVFVWVGASGQGNVKTVARSEYVISAKAGGVNLVEGTVGIVRRSGGGGRLIKGDRAEVGDRISTGADGRAEVLLNPGSFLRLGGDSAFEFRSTALEDLRLRLDGGSAIFEVFAGEDFEVSVSTPKAQFLLIETGVYRIDVRPSGEARLEVWKGRARVDSSSDIVKGGRVAITGPGGSSIAKFDRDEMDALDSWSKLRGKELAKVTSRLKDRNVRTALMTSFIGRSWNVFGSFGLWVFDRAYGGFVFLPFGYGWNSPYGYGYACYLGWYDLPRVVWNPPPPPPSTGGGPVNGPITTAGDRRAVPPFVRMQQTMDGGGVGGGRGGDTGITPGINPYDPGYNPSPKYSPGPTVTPPQSPSGTGKGDPPLTTKQP